MQGEHRQGEVIDPVAHLGDLHLHGVVLVDLRQDHHVRAHHLLHGVEQVGGVGLLEEARPACPLAGVGKGVQADDGRVVCHHVLERLGKESLGALALHVDVDLLLAKGAPDLLGGAVGELGLHIGRAGLALVDGVHLLLRGEAALLGPEVLVADEEVRELAGILLGQEVLEVGGLARDVVDHEVEHEVALVADAAHVVPGAKGRVHDVVAHGGKAAVRRGGKEGQDVHAAHGILEVGVEHLVQVGQVLAQAVGVGDEHDLVAELHVPSFPVGRPCVCFPAAWPLPANLRLRMALRLRTAPARGRSR